MKSGHQDSSTGIADRRQFDRQLNRAWLNAQKTGNPLSLLLCDIDHFKSFNNCYGRPAGDACLRRTAEVLQATLHRPTDLAAQYEGGKFAILLPYTEAHDTLIIADRMLADVRSLAIPHEQSDAAQVVTISIGGHSLWPVPGLSTKIITNLAETRLFQAKHCGGNQSRLCTACREKFED
ncbi:diguanylate cyclase (GGDEF) domain-containing protein [Candidatus Electrothrix marina]|uniref:diguanylate cyclase n=1 Tax=Candidatus Electrothrix marina TaxID=1859130 RepID=A0A3S3UCT3_9BACT|nr:diguanylate cyclase (GGDEF) domain-containing protein [Candidatus Electrothrix marina]